MNSYCVADLYGRWRTGDRNAGELLFSTAFHRLKAIAASLLSRERPGHTLQATALVSEFYLKLYRTGIRIHDADHFFYVSARAMRQVLVDHARSKKAAKRVTPELAGELLSGGRAADCELLLSAKICLEKLRRFDAPVAESLRLRYVEGATIQETAAALRLEAWRIRDNVEFGLEWMADELSSIKR